MESGMPVDIYRTPAGMPPPGQVANLINPSSPQKLVRMTVILCLSVTTIAVSLRIFTKVYIMKHIQIEDYALMAAQLGFVPWVVLILVTPGSAHHIWDVSIHTAMQFAKYENIVLIIYSPLTFLVKLSILMQLQHIFVTSHRQVVFFLLQALIWANLAFYLADFFTEIFNCVPRHKIWDTSISGKCVSVNVLLIVTGGVNVLSDCLILTIPTVLIFRLQITMKNKLAVVAVFGSGLFTLVASITRLVYSLKLLHTTDTIRTAYPVALWAIAEIATIILATTFPTMPRLWKHLRRGESSGQRSPSTERLSAPFSPQRPRQPVRVRNSLTTDDIIPLKGRYQELQDGKKGRRREELEMQILKTETYEVTSQLKALPEIT